MGIDDYRPTLVVEAIYDLGADDSLRRGIHAVLVDLGNTLIAWNNPDGAPEVRVRLDEMVMADISVVVVSNNKHSRVNRVVSRSGVDFVSRAMKPFTRGINMVIKRYGSDRGKVIMVGGQLMTDIRVAHRADTQSVLVRPLMTSDAWNIKTSRWRERHVWAKLEEKYGRIQYREGI